MRTVNIIGAGLAGSILKKVLDADGFITRIIDAELPWRASIISENLFDETWIPAIGMEKYMGGIEILQKHFAISKLSFGNAYRPKAKRKEIYHIPPGGILFSNFIKDKIVSHDENGCTGSSGTYYQGVNVYCTGYWAKDLIKEKMNGLTGQGLLFNQQWSRVNHIDFVTPRVHQKVMKWQGLTWYGDSTCILYENYLPKQEFFVNRCIERAKRFGLQDLKEVCFGIRPWVEDYKGFVKRLDSNNFVNTGGWKCGLIIYSYNATIIKSWLRQLQ